MSEKKRSPATPTDKKKNIINLEKRLLEQALAEDVAESKKKGSAFIILDKVFDVAFQLALQKRRNKR